MSQVLMPSYINTANTMSLNKRNHSSILAHKDSEGKLEIQGFYWPRVLLRESDKGKNEDKKCHKVKRNVKKHSSISPSKRLPLHPPATDSLLQLLQSVPSLVCEEHCHTTSPITGKPITSPKIKKSLLIPSRPVRKQLQRRSESNDSSFSQD